MPNPINDFANNEFYKQAHEADTNSPVYFGSEGTTDEPSPLVGYRLDVRNQGAKSQYYRSIYYTLKSSDYSYEANKAFWAGAIAKGRPMVLVSDIQHFTHKKAQIGGTHSEILWLLDNGYEVTKVEGNKTFFEKKSAGKNKMVDYGLSGLGKDAGGKRPYHVGVQATQSILTRVRALVPKIESLRKQAPTPQMEQKAVQKPKTEVTSGVAPNPSVTKGSMTVNPASVSQTMYAEKKVEKAAEPQPLEKTLEEKKALFLSLVQQKKPSLILGATSDLEEIDDMDGFDAWLLENGEYYGVSKDNMVDVFGVTPESVALAQT